MRLRSQRLAIVCTCALLVGVTKASYSIQEHRTLSICESYSFNGTHTDPPQECATPLRELEPSKTFITKENLWDSVDFMFNESYMVDSEGDRYRLRCADTQATSFIVIENATADQNGVIYKHDLCEAVEHSSCAHENRSTIVMPTADDCHAFDEVVSLSSWNTGFWHLVMEVSTGLAALQEPESFLQDHPGVVFQVRVRQNMDFLQQWLDVIGWGSIKQSLVTGPCIHAQRLMLPQLGSCLAPSQYQVNWLRDHARRASASVDLSSGTGRRALLVSRTKTRVPLFWSQIRDHLVRKGYDDIVEYNDGKELGSVKEQLALFAHADLIVAPHGAGLLNIIAASPTACVIEFIPEDHDVLCFIELGAKLNLTYSATLYRPQDETPDLTFFDQALRRCERSWR